MSPLHGIKNLERTIDEVLTEIGQEKAAIRPSEFRSGLTIAFQNYLDRCPEGDDTVLSNLSRSMPKRFAAVRAADGGHTDW